MSYSVEDSDYEMKNSNKSPVSSSTNIQQFCVDSYSGKKTSAFKWIKH